VSPVVAPWETQARTLERLASCPVAVWTILFGDALASFIFGAAISIVPVVVGLGAGVSIVHPFIMVLSIVLAAFCFSSLALLLSFPPSSSPATTMMLSSLVKFPLVFISGIFIPLSQLPVWGRGVSYISPLTYFTDIGRSCFQGEGHLPLAVDFAVLIAFTALFLVVAIKLHQRTMPRRI
jgi:ABC-2 type transport system permease protein